MLYSYSAPSGEAIVIVPVGSAHVGCTTLAVGSNGAFGTALIVTDNAGEIHVGSETFLAVTL